MLSGTELVIILILALLLLGPQELPKVAKTLGKGMREFQKATNDLKSVVETEFAKMETEINKAGEPAIAPPTPAPVPVPAPSAVPRLAAVPPPPEHPAELATAEHDDLNGPVVEPPTATSQASTPSDKSSTGADRDPPDRPGGRRRERTRSPHVADGAPGRAPLAAVEGHRLGRGPGRALPLLRQGPVRPPDEAGPGGAPRGLAVADPASGSRKSTSSCRWASMRHLPGLAGHPLPIWRFVAPGLYQHERRLVAPFVLGGTGFFLGGAIFCYFVILPTMFQFLLTEGTTPGAGLGDGRPAADIDASGSGAGRRRRRQEAHRERPAHPPGEGGRPGRGAGQWHPDVGGAEGVGCEPVASPRRGGRGGLIGLRLCRGPGRRTESHPRAG